MEEVSGGKLPFFYLISSVPTTNMTIIVDVDPGHLVVMFLSYLKYSLEGIYHIVTY